MQESLFGTMTRYDKKASLHKIALDNDIQGLHDMINNDNRTEEIFSLAAIACVEKENVDMLDIILEMTNEMNITWTASNLLQRAAKVKHQWGYNKH